MKRSSKRRDRVKYVDPVTGLTEYRYVEKVTYRYEDEKKVPIVIEFLTCELKNTSINITCSDRNGNIVKRVISSDDGTIEDDENPTDTSSGGGSDSGNPSGGGSTGGSGECGEDVYE